MDTIPTFAAVASQWIEAKRQLVKHSSFCTYNLALNIHLLPIFADATEITEQQAQKLVIDKLADGMSRKSVKNVLAELKAIIHYGKNDVDSLAKNGK